MIYLFVFFLLLFLSLRYDINGKTKYRDEWYLAMLVVFILIAGLRWRIGIDTTRYLYGFYHKQPIVTSSSFVSYLMSSDPLWVLLNSIVKSMGGRFYVVQIFHALIINGLVFKYIKKHSSYIFTCLIFYYISSYFFYNMEVLRASLSIVVCLYANDYFLNKKWLKGYSLCILAMLFHIQTIILFIMPFLLFLRLNKIGILILIGAFFVGLIIRQLVGDYLIMLLEDGGRIEDKAMGYVESDHYGASQALRTFLGQSFPKIVYSLGAIYFLRKVDPRNLLLRFEPCIMFYCMFLLMQFGFKIAYRYVDYYEIYASLFYVECFVKCAHNISFSRGLAYCRAVLLFLPLFLCLLLTFFNGANAYLRFYPYSSVVEKKVDKGREKRFSSSDAYYPPNQNEY